MIGGMESDFGLCNSFGPYAQVATKPEPQNRIKPEPQNSIGQGRKTLKLKKLLPHERNPKMTQQKSLMQKAMAAPCSHIRFHRSTLVHLNDVNAISTQQRHGRASAKLPDCASERQRVRASTSSSHFGINQQRRAFVLVDNMYQWHHVREFRRNNLNQMVVRECFWFIRYGGFNHHCIVESSPWSLVFWNSIIQFKR